MSPINEKHSLLNGAPIATPPEVKLADALKEMEHHRLLNAALDALGDQRLGACDETLIDLAEAGLPPEILIEAAMLSAARLAVYALMTIDAAHRDNAGEILAHGFVSTLKQGVDKSLLADKADADHQGRAR